MPYASGIQLINDPNGAAYAFLADNGAIWQCQWDAEAQRWEQGLQVPGALGGEKLQALYVEDLWPNGQTGGSGQGATANAGIVLAYRVGEGSAAEIHASFGSWDSDGQLTWSASTPLSSDGVEDQAFTLMPAADGGFWLVAQKQEGGRVATAAMEQALALEASNQAELNAQLQQQTIGSRPDKDLYRSHFALQRGPTSGAEAQFTLLENGSAGSTLVSTDQATTPQPAPQQRPFAGNSQLQRADVLQGITSTGENSSGPSSALILSSTATTPTATSTTSAPSQALSSDTATRGWSGGAWSLGSHGDTFSAGVSLFPVRWRFSDSRLQTSAFRDRITEDDDASTYLSLVLSDGPDPASYADVSGYRAASVPSWSHDSTATENLADDLVDPRSALASNEDAEIVEEVVEIGSDFEAALEPGNEVASSAPRASLISPSDKERNWSGLFGGTNVGGGGSTVVDFAKLREEVPLSSSDHRSTREDRIAVSTVQIYDKEEKFIGNSTWKAFTFVDRSARPISSRTAPLIRTQT